MIFYQVIVLILSMSFIASFSLTRIRALPQRNILSQHRAFLKFSSSKGSDDRNFSPSLENNPAVRDWIHNLLLTLNNGILPAPHHNFVDLKNIDFNIGTIINNPSITMAHELIDFDVSSRLAMIENNAKIPRDKLKPLFAMVKGIGGGKTRTLEEFRRKFMTKEDTLLLAITFGPNYRIQNIEKTWGSNSKDAVALSVFARMVSVLYDIDLKKVCDAIHNSWIAGSTITGLELLQECIGFAVGTVSSYRKQPVKTLILLADDLQLIDDIITERFKEVDSMAVLRESMLDPIVQTTDETTATATAMDLNSIQTALVFSSSTLPPIGVDFSSRPIKSFSLPASLDVDKIVNNWWDTKLMDSDDKYKLRLIAALTSNHPLGIEIANEYIVAHKTGPVDGEYTQELMDYMMNKLNIICSSSEFL